MTFTAPVPCTTAGATEPRKDFSLEYYARYKCVCVISSFSGTRKGAVLKEEQNFRCRSKVAPQSIGEMGRSYNEFGKVVLINIKEDKGLR